MELLLTFKQLGKKNAILEDFPVILNCPNDPITFKSLLEIITQNQIEQFHSRLIKSNENEQTPISSEHYIPLLMQSGKIDFNTKNNLQETSVLKAQEDVIQAFEDGLFVVFYGEDELVDLQQIITLQPEKKMMFIRLTFLAGSHW